MRRTYLLNLSDLELLKICEVSAYKGSGNGGQHRNKTMSGVKLKLAYSNAADTALTPNNEGEKNNPQSQNIIIETYSCEDRSSHINKLSALKKMRLQIALQIREKPSEKIPFPFPGSGGHISHNNPLYPQFIADVFDRLSTNAILYLSRQQLNKNSLQLSTNQNARIEVPKNGAAQLVSNKKNSNEILTETANAWNLSKSALLKILEDNKKVLETYLKTKNKTAN